MIPSHHPLPFPTIRHAERTPSHPALIDQTGTLTYAELEEQIRRVAGSLCAYGCHPGARLILCARNSSEWAVTAHAAARAGLVLVPLDVRMPPEELRAVCRSFAAELVVTDRGDVPTGCAGRIVSLAELMSDGPAHTKAIRDTVEPQALHTIVLTSGSTGKPRGVCLSFANHLSSALASALNLGIDPDDRWLVNLPLHHIGGLSIIMRAAFYGTTAVIQRGFDADATAEAIRRQRVTQLSLVSTTLHRLLDTWGNETFPEHVRHALIGGGPVTESLLTEARTRGLRALATYGMTETTAQIVTQSPACDFKTHPVAGQPLAFSELQIRDDDGHTLPPGSPGNIHVKGPTVGLGYWRSRDEIASFCIDGWYRTDDVGICDDAGNLSVLGRVDNAIITGGEKVFPEEIEAALTDYPGVRRAAVIGVAHPEWGEEVVALLEEATPAGVDIAGVHEFLKARLSRHKLPKRYEIIAAFPELPNGKLDRRSLAATFLKT